MHKTITMKVAMRRLLLASAVSASVACSDPQCGDGETKIGKTCFSLTHKPSDAATADSAATLLDGDASDHRATSDASLLDAAGPSAENTDGAAANASDAQEPDAAGPARCGDGIVQTQAGETCEPNGSPQCASSCSDNDSCTLDSTSGSAQSCDLSCTHVAITSPINADGCCPPGGNLLNDNDCHGACGNGVVETGEACDGNCPTSCAAPSGCMSHQLQGSGCGIRCEDVAITAPVAGDGCCPPGANHNTDSDCPSICGNGAIETGELCDSNCPTSCAPATACTSNKLQGSGCGVSCVAITITTTASGDGCCPPGANHNTDSDCPVACGNNVVEAGEQCDDGNTNSDDGCNACQWADISTTPGDDRPLYFKCFAGNATCGPNQRCDSNPSSPSVSFCTASSAYSGCDGPEDCPSNTPYCTELDGQTNCSSTLPTTGSEYGLKCHVVSQCPVDRSLCEC